MTTDAARSLEALALGALVLGALALGAGCKSVGLSAPPDATISLTVSPQEIPVNGGMSRVQATVLRGDGSPVADGTEVFFFATLGTVDERAETSAGVAEATLRSSGVEGVAAVTAVSGNAVSANVEVTIGVGAEVLTLTGTPATVGSSGGSSIMTATLRDASGRGVPGRVVLFSATDPGRLASAGAGVETDDQGQATDTLTTTAASTVTATVVGATLSREFTVTVEDQTVSGVSVSASPVPLPVGGGSATVTAIVFDDRGQVVSGETVAFTVEDPGVVSPSSAVTNSSGAASTTLTSTETVTVTAVAGGSAGSIEVRVSEPTDPEARTLSLSALDSLILDHTDPIDPCGVSANPELPVGLLAVVTDSSASPVAGATVTLQIEDLTSDDFDALGGFCLGGSLDPGPVNLVTDSMGRAEIDYSFSAADLAMCAPPAPDACSTTIVGTTSGASTALAIIQIQ